MEKLLFVANTDHYRKPKLVIMQRGQTYTSATQILPLLLRAHSKERLWEGCKSQRTGKPAVRLDLLERTGMLHSLSLNNMATLKKTQTRTALINTRMWKGNCGGYHPKM